MAFSNLLILIWILNIKSLFGSELGSDSLFSGIITITETKEPSIKGLENYLNQNRIRSAYTDTKIDEIKWKNEYNLSLSQKIIIYINLDTLISFNINMVGDTLGSFIQIKNNNYFKGYFMERYIKTNIRYGIEGVKKWEDIKNKVLQSKNYKQYLGNHNQEIFNLTVDHTYSYGAQSELGYNFKNIFFEGGIIMYKNDVYSPGQLNRTNEVKDITYQKISCKDIIFNLSFTPDENEKPLTSNSIFFKYDTVILSTELRPKPTLFLHSNDKDSISISQLTGKYKHISFIIEKFNILNQLKKSSDDLLLSFQNKNIRFYTVVLLENHSKTQKINVLSKNNTSIYYLKNGIDNPIFNQTKQLSYPICFLFDEEGKIILVNAPPRSNPSLGDVLDRLE